MPNFIEGMRIYNSTIDVDESKVLTNLNMLKDFKFEFLSKGKRKGIRIGTYRIDVTTKDYLTREEHINETLDSIHQRNSDDYCIGIAIRTRLLVISMTM